MTDCYSTQSGKQCHNYWSLLPKKSYLPFLQIEVIQVLEIGFQTPTILRIIHMHSLLGGGFVDEEPYSRHQNLQFKHKWLRKKSAKSTGAARPKLEKEL